MPKTSTCPKCQESITLVEAPDASLVACPFCNEQFELAEALDFVAESGDENGPPAVLVIEIRETGEPVEDRTAEDELLDVELPDDVTADENTADPLFAERPVLVRCPCCRDSFALEALLLAETDEPLGPEAASAVLNGSISQRTATSDEGRRFDFLNGAETAEDHSGFQLEAAAERPAASSAAFEFAAPVGGEASGEAPPESERPRRRRRETGGMKELSGVVLGGVAGLFITYYLLNLFGGARFDALKIYLPGIKHTAAHRPDWLGGPPEGEEFDSGIGDSMGMGLETPAPAAMEPVPTDQQETQQAAPVETPAETPAKEPMPDVEPLPEDYAGLIDPPLVTSGQLGEALKEVSLLPETGPLTEEGYEAWCRLAMAATFVDRNDGDPQTQNRLDATRRLIKKLTAADVVKIGQFATRRTVNPNRPDRGILLAGTVRKPNTKKGHGFMTGLVVAGSAAQVVVACDRPLPLEAESRVLLLGYLIDQPGEVTQGLDTELSQIVWCRTVVEFEQ